MNLHGITVPGMWLWFRARSGNGQGMGSHIWKGEWPAEAPPLPNRPTWYTDRSYQQLLSSTLYGAVPLMPWDAPSLTYSRPWPRPLCGKRSASRFASFVKMPPNSYRECVDCARLARERGINAHYSGDPAVSLLNPHREIIINFATEHGLTL